MLIFNHGRHFEFSDLLRMIIGTVVAEANKMEASNGAISGLSRPILGNSKIRGTASCRLGHLTIDSKSDIVNFIRKHIKSYNIASSVNDSTSSCS